MRACGFADGEIAEARIDKISGPGGWYLLSGTQRT